MLKFLLPLVGARIKMGKCWDSDVAMQNFEPEKLVGTWYEAFRDYYTFFEWGGTCNHMKITLSDPDPELATIKADEGHSLVLDVHNYQ